MRIGVNLGPTGDWSAMLAAAQTADASGFDALGFLDHYHSNKPEWPYICGWSAYGALAMATSRIHLVPMVIDHLNYLTGVLARETSTLSIISAGRFELVIRSAVEYADEINVYADEDLMRFARHEIEASHRAITLSAFVWDWPEDIGGKLAAWEQLGVERTFLTFWHPFDQLAHATKWMS